MPATRRKINVLMPSAHVALFPRGMLHLRAMLQKAMCGGVMARMLRVACGRQMRGLFSLTDVLCHQNRRAFQRCPVLVLGVEGHRVFVRNPSRYIMRNRRRQWPEGIIDLALYIERI